jgi:hypothetical protein
MRSSGKRHIRSALQESLLSRRGKRDVKILERAAGLSGFFPLEVIPNFRERAFHQIFKIRVSESLAFRGVSQLAEEMRKLGVIDVLTVFATKEYGMDFIGELLTNGF